jgi:hypothetical protein
MYQWQLYGGTVWIDLLNLGHYTGVTTDSLVVTGISSSMNNYEYRCIVSGCTNDTSDVGVLTIINGIDVRENQLEKLVLTPNPTEGVVRVNLTSLGKYELLTLDGRILESGTAKEDYDLRKYPSGIYNLRLSTQEGTYIFKVMKN